ncbi:hypothetical protein AHF37_05404 [Paragonimus kellicotti]|nr:hypothetical protein AHF37_05404 [Paragonimus kellicotti]
MLFFHIFSSSVLDQKLLPFGLEHNFWRAGQSSGAGLCGPSTEIHVDFRGLSNQEGLRCARCLINTSSPQVMELWNCVFITHRLQPSEDGAFRVDLLEPLGKRFVDTGMGLERLACVMQGVTSTYDSDAFTPLLEFIHANATTSSWTPPKYGGEFLPFCRQHLSETTEENIEASRTVVQRSLPNFLRNLIAPKKVTRLACPTIQCMELQGDRSHFHSAGSHSDQCLPDTDLITRWHRDTAYRLLADHSRALAHSLADGLLPGRQGLALKLRQLIQRSTRAAVLTGLDHAERSVSLLAILVAEVAKRESLASASSIPALQGPSARQPSSLSYDEMTNLINQEVRAFIPRVHDLELAFERCLEENPDCTHLSAEQVRGLIDGKYGVPVSWDMLCAQSHWAGLCVPDPITVRNSNASGAAGTNNRRLTNSVLGTPLARQLQDAHVPFTDDSAKYSYDRRTDDSPSSCAKYVIPSCRSRVVGLLISDPNTQEYLLITDRCQHTIPLSSNKRESVFGCLVERTNFFAKEGGQDYDTGSIRIGFTTLDVVHVEAVTSPVEDPLGWVIHWCRIPQDQSGEDLARLCFDDEAELLVDETRRVQLMRHHTGQHLFVWALDAYVRGLQTSGVPATFQHHGGAVHPDNFVVNAAIVNPSDDSDKNIDHLVDQVESLCRMVIAQKLVVQSISVDWDRIVTFTAIVGEAARSARLRGDSLIAEALQRESEQASLHDLSNHIEWLSSVLSNSSQSPTLPMRAREQLERCLHRMKTARAVGSQNQRMQLSDVLVEHFAKLLTQNDAVNPNVVLITPIDFSNSEMVIKALLQIKPSRPIIAYGDRMAVCYFPGSSKDSRVRRFPWVTYPKVVKTVCIGAEPWKTELKHRATNGHLYAASAELCSGTHLKNTADLFDCVVTSVRSRKHTVKEFTAIVGEAARSARLRGDSLIAEALQRESEQASLHDLSNHIEWLSSVLSNSSQSPTLPMRAREQLERCLHRMKTARAVGSQNQRMQLSDVLVEHFAKLLTQNDAVNPNVVLITPIDFSNSEMVIKALLQIKPSRPIIAYGDRMAVCYFPGSSKTVQSTALNSAHAIARSLSQECAVHDWTVKARPLRSNVINESNRYMFALLELTRPEQPTSANDPNEREVSQWNLLHAALENSAKAVLFPTVTSCNTLRST